MPSPILHFVEPKHTETDSTIHIAHANGFPPPLYAAFAQSLNDLLPQPTPIIGLSARPLWANPPSPETLPSWHVMANDLLADIEAYNLAPLIGIGHSMGGVATLLAAIQKPAWFRAVVLLDPVLLPRMYLRTISWLKRIGIKFEYPLVNAALKRRRRWENAEIAFERFRGREVFARFSDEALRIYVESMTQPSQDYSGGIELRYAPEWEAQIYRSIPHDIWRSIPYLKVPSILIHGAETDTFLPLSQRLWRRLRPDIPLIGVPQTGHLLPIESPSVVARHVADFLIPLLISP